MQHHHSLQQEPYSQHREHAHQNQKMKPPGDTRRNKGTDPEPQLIIRRHLSGEPLIFSKQTSQEVPTKQPKPRRYQKTHIHRRNIRSRMQTPIRNPLRPRKKHPLHPMVNPEQISRHKNFSKTENIPVFIVLGTRGDPKDPEHVFCIPLNDIKYPEIYESIFEKIIPKRTSVYRNGILFRIPKQISVSISNIP